MEKEQNVQPNVQPNIQPDQQLGGQETAPVTPEAAPVTEVPVQPQQAVVEATMGHSTKGAKKIPKGAIIGVIVAVVVAIAAFVGIKLLSTSPYGVYKGVIKEAFSKGREILGFDNEQEDSAVISGNLKIESNISGMEEISTYSYDYLLGVDTANNKAELMLGLKENGTTVLDAFIYLLNNRAYLKSDKIYNSVLDLGSTTLDFSGLSTDYSVEDIEYLYDKLEEALINSFDNDDFESQSATIKVDGKDVKVKENYVNITGKNLNKVMKGFINTFKNDKKALEILAKITTTDSSSIEAMLSSLLEVDLSATEGKVKISIYTKSMLNKVTGYALEFDGEQVIYAGFDGEKGEIVITGNDTELIAEKDGNVTAITIKEYGDVAISGKITKVSDDEIKVEINLDGGVVTVNIVNKEESKNVSTQNIVVAIDNDYNESLKITLSNKIDTSAAVADINVSGAKDINSLSETEISEMTEELLTIIEKTPFYSIIESLMGNYGSVEDDYFYGEDFYFDEDDFYYEDDYFYNDDYYYDDSY